MALVLRRKITIITKMREIVRSPRKPWPWRHNAGDDGEDDDGE